MNTLFVLLLFIFGGVALMVVLGERFASPKNPEQIAKLSRWILPLCAVAIVIQLIRYLL